MRKNCLFAGSETGGQNLAIILSFVETCRANKISFRVWLEDLLQIARTNQFPIQFFWMQDILLVESPGKKEDARADDDDNQFNEGKKNAFTFHRVPFPFHSPFRHFELDSSLRLIGSVEDTPFRFCFNRLKNQPMKQTESPAKKAKRTSKNERD